MFLGMAEVLFSSIYGLPGATNVLKKFMKAAPISLSAFAKVCFACENNFMKELYGPRTGVTIPTA